MAAEDVTFDAFWQDYLRAHARSGTRAMHILGTAIGTVALIAGLVLLDPLIALIGIALGYCLAWSGHFLVENNMPAMVKRPWWSLQCDLRMFRLWLMGNLAAELKKAGVD